MTPRQMALSRLSRLALNSVSGSPPNERAEVYQLVAVAIREDCPDLAELAAAAALSLHTAAESEAELLNLLNT